MLAEPTQAITPENSKRELARRELARRRLINYAEYMAPWYETQAFHKLIAQKLQDVEFYVANRGQASRDGRKGISRLIVQMPPQYGKTQLVSRLFPSWFMGRNPNYRVMLASYGADLAHENSQHVRDFVSSVEYKNIFGSRATVDLPVDLSPDSRKKSGWDLAAPHRGGMAAAGVGGPLTGKGADLLIIDDPFKDREQAESEAYRTSLKEWFSSVALQRVRPYGAVLIVNTRWDPEDLSGYLLKEMAFNEGADWYEVLSLPAIAPALDEYAVDEEDQRRNLAQGIWLDIKDPLDRQPGEVLWPSHFTLDEVLRKKATTTPHDWLALHMQMPRSRTGGFFNSSKWEVWPWARVPKDLQWFRVWDLAVSPKKKSDQTAGAAIAMDLEGTLYIRDMRKWRASWPKSKEEIIQISQEADAPLRGSEHPKEIWGVETVAFQLAAFQELQADPRMADRAIYDLNPEGDKESMALPLQSRLDMGKVVLVDGPWVRGFMDIAALFPRPSVPDDEIDTVTKGMQLIREIAGRHVPTGRQLIAVM